jgi:hypothetical protein
MELHWAVYDAKMRRTTACGQQISCGVVHTRKETRVTCAECKAFLAKRADAAKAVASRIRKRLRSVGYNI